MGSYLEGSATCVVSDAAGALAERSDLPGCILSNLVSANLKSL